ncbi:hypothetical protein PLEOSDRAFT_1103400 [Pleurotus ostreatus PC15]|uniref:Uncharacterized protein n=1 Tax=Pleurotus ostreatus (strain PC15) TaxID=1137138 RepID=A0A067P0J8_PLEO1|nr:hypothetical protein PLEOSDRAFT_1103400 [Pleurotus ostreatus PC15]
MPSLSHASRPSDHAADIPAICVQVHQFQRAEIEDNVLGAKSIFEPIRTS